MWSPAVADEMGPLLHRVGRPAIRLLRARAILCAKIDSCVINNFVAAGTGREVCNRQSASSPDSDVCVGHCTRPGLPWICRITHKPCRDQHPRKRLHFDSAAKPRRRSSFQSVEADGRTSTTALFQRVGRRIAATPKMAVAARFSAI